MDSGDWTRYLATLSDKAAYQLTLLPVMGGQPCVMTNGSYYLGVSRPARMASRVNTLSWLGLDPSVGIYTSDYPSPPVAAMSTWMTVGSRLQGPAVVSITRQLTRSMVMFVMYGSVAGEDLLSPPPPPPPPPPPTATPAAAAIQLR